METVDELLCGRDGFRWEKAGSSSCERWRRNRRSRRRVRVREEARADGRKESQRTSREVLLFSFLVYLGSVCV